MPGCTETADIPDDSSSATFLRSVSQNSGVAAADPMEIHPQKHHRSRGILRQWQLASMKHSRLFRIVVIAVVILLIAVLLIAFLISSVALSEVNALKERTAKLEATLREITAALSTTPGGMAAEDGPRAAAVAGLPGGRLQPQGNGTFAFIKAVQDQMEDLESRLNGFHCLNQSAGESLQGEINQQSAVSEMMKVQLAQVSANLSSALSAAQERLHNQSTKMAALESQLNRTSCLDRAAGESLQREMSSQSQTIQAMNSTLLGVSYKLEETSSALSNVSGQLGSVRQRVDSSHSQASQAKAAVLAVQRTVASLASNVTSAGDVIRQSVLSVSNLTQTVELLTRATVSRSCQDYLQRGFSSSGVYTLLVAASMFRVFCDMDTDGGGWLVIQRRQDGSEDFYRNWADYQRGFGNLQGEFWLGLDKLTELTSSAPMRLRVEMEDWAGNKKWAEYSSFAVSPSSQQYMLRVSGYSGNGSAVDALSYHNGQGFTTYDVDHDNRNDNCAKIYHGAFWHKGCLKTNPNGRYGNSRDWSYVVWEDDFLNQPAPLKAFQMKLR